MDNCWSNAENATDLSGPLAKLINLGYIERETPFGESPRNSKRSYYQICDPFMRTYYRYVIPNRSLINLNRKDIVTKTISDTFSDFVAAHWERLCRNAVSGSQLLGTTWGMASRWWGTVIINKEKKNIELDVWLSPWTKRKSSSASANGQKASKQENFSTTLKQRHKACLSQKTKRLYMHYSSSNQLRTVLPTMCFFHKPLSTISNHLFNYVVTT